MKKLLPLLFIAITLHATAQPPVKDGKVFYEETSTVSQPKNAIFNAARLWFVNTFRDYKSALQVADKEEGLLAGKGNVECYMRYGLAADIPLLVNFTFKIDIKDNKYRIQVYNIWCNELTPDLYYPVERYNAHPQRGNNQKILNAADKCVKQSLDSLKQFELHGLDDNF